MIAVSGRLTSAVPDGNTPPIHLLSVRGYLENIKWVFKKMKKNVSILSIVLCILVISTLILFAEEVKYDFRQTNWGMSREQVKETEREIHEWEDWAVNYYIDFKGTIQDTECKTLEYYPVEINGKNYTCQYVFLEDKLYRGRYSSNFGDVDEYRTLKKLLSKKYGKTETDKSYDYYNPYRFEYVATWETPTTIIKLGLEKLWGDWRRTITISYWNKELMRQKQQKEEKERIDKLTEEENKSNL